MKTNNKDLMDIVKIINNNFCAYACVQLNDGRILEINREDYGNDYKVDLEAYKNNTLSQEKKKDIDNMGYFYNDVKSYLASMYEDVMRDIEDVGYPCVNKKQLSIMKKCYLKVEVL